MTRIGFIRHGITDWNVEGRVQGQTDIPLNEAGRKQAYALADRLKGEEWDLIYSSDLSRTGETAEIVAKALGLPVRTDIRLREMHCGEVEGTTPEERIARWGKDWKSLPLNIESSASIVDRGLSFVFYLLDNHAGSSVLVVSHGALVRLTLKVLIPHVDTKERLRNASITTLAHLNGSWDCALYNCAKHIF
ncbi:putative phosphoglycerate mutase [Neolewinella xylanilytica]|uniref:Putative phosphoglycerate mutase n=1 Tax=Neolewinella xylanilytica TaxID=1514080 RepID=A0A2S6I867_9BACT|nr:histidine phosphatase family protein [Neolewinella xylanilytica]PPK87681.1 putative phosphoglycerate mutase [Neolewinella xylanilytica]